MLDSPLFLARKRGGGPGVVLVAILRDDGPTLVPRNVALSARTPTLVLLRVPVRALHLVPPDLSPPADRLRERSLRKTRGLPRPSKTTDRRLVLEASLGRIRRARDRLQS